MKTKIGKFYIFICFLLFCVTRMNFFYLQDSLKIFVASIFCSLTLFFIISDKIVAWIAAVVVTVVLNINNIDYLFLSLFVLFLIIAYRENMHIEKSQKKNKKQEKTFSSWFLIIAICFGAVALIFCLDSYFAINQKTYYTDFFHIEYLIILCIMLFLFVASIVLRKKGYEIPVTLSVVYLINIIFYFEMIFYCYVTLKGDSHVYRCILFPWHAYLSMIICGDDPVVKTIIVSVDKALSGFVNKKQVTK